MQCSEHIFLTVRVFVYQTRDSYQQTKDWLLVLNIKNALYTVFELPLIPDRMLLFCIKPVFDLVIQKIICIFIKFLVV